MGFDLREGHLHMSLNRLRGIHRDWTMGRHSSVERTEKVRLAGQGRERLVDSYS